MAHRDLTHRFHERRQAAKQHKQGFRMRILTTNPSSVRALFQSKQHLKSRAMEKALLQEALECERLELGDSCVHKPEWTHFADDANEAIRLLHVKLEYLELLHTRRLMIRFDDTEVALEREIEQFTSDVTVLFQRAERSLKKITSPFIGGAPCLSPTDRLVRVNTQRAVASRLQDISHRFRRRQREYAERLQIQKFGCDMFDANDDEALLLRRTDNVRPAAIGGTARRHVALERHEFEIASRDSEIQRIAKSVALLATVFKDVADMVIDQGSLVDRIDYNMEQVVCRMRSGLKELQRAEKQQHSSRPERCIFILVASIFVCLALLILKHS